MLVRFVLAIPVIIIFPISVILVVFFDIHIFDWVLDEIEKILKNT